MTTATELRKQKTQWMKETLSEIQLKKELKLTSKEIKKLKAEKRYGKIRYQKNAVSWYLRLKDNNVSD